jgi:hypothetical protein
MLIAPEAQRIRLCHLYARQLLDPAASPMVTLQEVIDAW